MGRELKRVPLDFKWEIGKIWYGFINPHANHKCMECDGMGYSKEYNQLNEKWYSFGIELRKKNPFRKDCTYNALSWSNNLDEDDVKALIEADRLWDFTRVPLNDEQREIVRKKKADGGNSWLPFNNGYVPTAKEVNEWNLKGMGHDSLNAYTVIKAKLKRQGLSHLCPKCNGSGSDWQSEKAKELYENWKDYEPPKGDGYQLWSTTTEGHPMTPVFPTLDELCEYLEVEKVSLFGSSTATKEHWKSMLDENFVRHEVGSMVFI